MDTIANPPGPPGPGDGQEPPDSAARAAEMARLRQSEARLRLLFDQSVVGIVIANGQGIVRDANAAILAMLGYDRESFLGTDMRTVIHPDDQRALPLDVVHAGIAAGNQPGVERRYRRADGTYLPVSVSFGLFDPESRLHQVMVQDISAQKAIEAERALALSQAEAASQTKSVFLAHMSHELRTPLNGVMGMLQLAQMANDSPETAEYLNAAMASAQGLLRILSDILEVSALHDGLVRLTDEAFDLDEAIDPVLASLDREAHAKGLVFSHGIAPDVPPRLRGDVGRLRQILYNLAANAIKYTSTGRVRLTVATVPQPDPRRIRLVFSLADTGIGIPEHRQATVLEAFTQVGPLLTRRFGGVGLGLSIAKGLTEQMGGSLTLTSVEQEGTTVQVELPFALSEQPAVRSFAPAASLTGLRVLVAEDEAINRLTIQKMLEKLGCRPHLTQNGREALDALAQNAFDCVLMDIRMPEMDGLTAVQALRQGQAGEAARQMPVVALTAHALAEDKQAAFDAGVNAYLVKPVDMAELGRLLARLLADGREHVA
ncbi:response regulator [Desulfovibrio aerotolerans]|uniref:histidine kinase n=1 Tax=Solidesulfovibrio aerotolerans TaxID=295255 RepID=A0A7C9MGA8_9BACT|nr:response regulator [Solidesulfovibrio aerotolerans]MYL81768.1 response regulator [Solidesulfovibrio aerotolerans]